MKKSSEKILSTQQPPQNSITSSIIFEQIKTLIKMKLPKLTQPINNNYNQTNEIMYSSSEGKHWEKEYQFL